ncbi:MAG TPA: response regulator [Verrucomicrobiae bacterium]|nr:response regulator [Verrucomicrobiae bacterium]
MTENTGPYDRRILVIDDNQSIHEDFRKIFSLESHSQTTLIRVEAILFGESSANTSQLAFHVDSAFQGQEGVERVERAMRDNRRYAMAFVDMRMPPGWDGVETVKRLWDVDPDLQVVLCTAYSDYSWEQMMEDIGHTDRLVILKKPFDNVEVLQLAHSLTEKWKLLQRSKVKMEDLERRVAGRTRELEAANEKLKAEIAERIRAEEGLRQAQKLEAIGQLAGGVAHDFNNILTVIQGHACGLLEDASLSQTALESAREVDEAAKRAARLTRQLLTFSRKQTMQREHLDLQDVVGQVVKMLHRVLGEDIALEIRPAEDAPAIQADRGMIEQIILNLAVNARDAMPRGGQLRIETKTVETTDEDARRNPAARAGRFACMSVSDTGCGIAPEILPRIFEPFFTTKEVGKGTGLGLATVYGIVRQHQGWIEIESAPGRGTTFRILLPASSELARLRGTPALSPQPTGGRETILLVEDEAPLLNLARTILQRQGYRIYTACSGAEALPIWSRHGPEIDLLITDVVMPGGLSGLELANRLQAERPQLKVTFTSGYSVDMAGHDGALQQGFTFLPKPYTPQELARTVRDCMNPQHPATSRS